MACTSTPVCIAAGFTAVAVLGCGLAAVVAPGLVPASGLVFASAAAVFAPGLLGVAAAVFAALVAALAFASPAFAQHSHGAHKGPNGGPVEDVAGVHAELIVSGTTITLNILDENNKPVKTASLRALLGQWRTQQMAAAE